MVERRERERERERERNRSAVHENLIVPATATSPLPLLASSSGRSRSEQEESLGLAYTRDDGRRISATDRSGTEKRRKRTALRLREGREQERGEECCRTNEEEMRMRIGERKTDCD